MFQLIENGKCANVFAAEGEESWVYLAAEDLQKDLFRVSGGGAEPLCRGVPEKNAIFIGTISNPQAAEAAKDAKQPSGKEGYAITVREDMVYILGADDFGTMWGVYTFCEEILHIPPCYLFDGVLPGRRQNLTVPAQTISGRPKSFGFRGFFINDEDLLTDWMEGGGTRNIDYPFYGRVIHPQAMEMIAETALRLKMNLIIPSSFVDICNPPEERLIAICARRGLYVSQHHIEPMGVSYFTFQNYFKARGETCEISFLSNREKMIEVWRHYAQKWAEYPRVVWQLGLRGKADRPVWHADKLVGSTPKERGGLISDAVNVQYELVKDVLGTETFYSTVTLWMEGADLFRQGYLTIPQKTSILFSDIGYNQLWSDDFWQVKREECRSYGVYYHVQFWSWGPHLTEGTPPDKMRYCLETALGAACGDYAILNVSNIREFTMSAFGFSKMAWDLPGADDTVLQYCTQLYGGAAKAVCALYRRYFDAFAEGSGTLLRRYCDKNNFNYHEYGSLPFLNLSLCDGFLRSFAQELMKGDEHFHDPDMENLCKDASKRFYAVYAGVKKVNAISGAAKAHLQGSLGLQSYSMHCLYDYAKNVKLGTDCVKKQNRQKARIFLTRAAENLDCILKERACAETGIFSSWYRGDKKMNILQMKQDVLTYLETI